MLIYTNNNNKAYKEPEDHEFITTRNRPIH